MFFCLCTSISCWDKFTLSLCFAGKPPPVDAGWDHRVPKPENIIIEVNLLTLKRLGVAAKFNPRKRNNVVCDMH